MIQRERYMQEIRDFMDKPVVKIITGMRRCGKSALLELTREELRRRGVQEQNIISMNFESLRYEAFKDYRALYQEVCKRADRAQGEGLYPLRRNPKRWTLGSKPSIPFSRP